MKGKKTSSEKIAEVITKKLENPDLSIRDLEKETGVPHNTAGRIINNEMGQIGATDRGRELINNNVEIINVGKRLIKTYLPALEIKNYSDLSRISEITETAFKQNRLIEGESTDIVEVKDYSGKTQKELEEIRSKLLN